MKFKIIDVEEIYKNDDKLKKEDVNMLMEWAEKQAHLPKVSELIMACFLHSCFYKIEAAKSAVDVYFTGSTLNPDMFQFKTLKDPIVKRTTDNNLVVILPKKAPNGDSVFILKPGENPENYHYPTQCKVLDAQRIIHLHEKGPFTGIHIVVDLKDVVFGHVIKLSTTVMAVKNYLYILQEGLPVRLKHIHFINIVSFIDKILAVIKPFMKKELQDKLRVHSDISSLFTYIPQDLLPVEYGGSCESSEVLKENVKKLIVENEEFLIAQDALVVDESKRTERNEKLNDVYGIAGSFKKLEVD
ncbi:alpha-tocopherol transfer protein-like [Diabrotica undecimpunctata]|uniref:alpha-tocopherol transfer protein-like n=1 Tax=Diabrotica undecimpunctata TaxID=50387 RepID=UPI003B634C02